MGLFSQFRTGYKSGELQLAADELLQHSTLLANSLDKNKSSSGHYLNTIEAQTLRMLKDKVDKFYLLARPLKDQAYKVICESKVLNEKGPMGILIIAVGNGFGTIEILSNYQISILSEEFKLLYVDLIYMSPSPFVPQGLNFYQIVNFMNDFF